LRAKSKIRKRFSRVQATGEFFEAPASKLDGGSFYVTPPSSPVYFAAIFGWTMSAVSAANVRHRADAARQP
jgi:hypothetical protein